MRADTVVVILVSLAVFCQAVPLGGTAAPANDWPISTSPELNVTGVNLTNHTLLSHYAVTPTLIRIEVRISETALPVSKGEMAAGPRSIGFWTDPVSLVVLIIAIIAGAAGVWYVIRPKPGECDEEMEE